MSSVGKVLLQTLKDLVEDELKEFKFHLRQDVPEVSPRFRRGELENTTLTDIIGQMENRYCHKTMAVTLYILKKMERNDLVEELQLAQAKGITLLYLCHECSYTSLHLEPDMQTLSHQGLGSIYTDVQIIDAAMPNETAVKCTDIFNVTTLHENSVRTVLMKGIAGIGKTMSVKRFVLGWANREANQEIDFLPHLNFKSAELYNSTKSATVEELLTNLIMGNLLHSALLWITSRPAAANQIPPECIHQVTEVRGFKDEQKEEYFRKRLKDPNLASKVLKHIKSSSSLFTMCHIPVFCGILATVLEQTIHKGQRGDTPQTLTQMYTQLVLIQMNAATQKYGAGGAMTPISVPEVAESTILKLGELAFRQLETGNLVFREEVLRECGLDPDEASEHFGLCTQTAGHEDSEGKSYCFVHLSIQEYMAALYVFLSYRNLMNDPRWHGLKWMLGTFSLNDLHKRAVDKALESESGHLDLFLRFLLGLSLESNHALLRGLLPAGPGVTPHTTDIEETVKYIQKKIKESCSSPERSINLFYCLNDLNDCSFVQEIQTYLSAGRLLQETLSPAQWSALVFVLLMSEDIQEMFDLKEYAQSDEGLQRLLPVQKNTKTALLDQCNLTKGCYGALASVLCSDSSNLSHLDLSNNNLQDTGAELLFTAMASHGCKLETLHLTKCNCVIYRLTRCNLTDGSCGALSKALLSRGSRLTELNLRSNRYVLLEPLSSALADPYCRLEKLDLGYNRLEAAAVQVVCSGLSGRLRSLNLSGSDLGVPRVTVTSTELDGSPQKRSKLDASAHSDGLTTLCEALQRPRCRLEWLGLRACSLGTATVEPLCIALASPQCPLRELDLRSNGLGDVAARGLAEALGSQHCGLERLQLGWNEVTHSGAESLAVVLAGPYGRLQELDLDHNPMGDLGAKALFARLANPHCKLRMLGLGGCILTEACCGDLATALCRTEMRELELSSNDLGDLGVRALSAGLEDTNCKLEKLGGRLCRSGFSSVFKPLSSERAGSELQSSWRLRIPMPCSYEMRVWFPDPSLLFSPCSMDHGGEIRMKAGLQKYGKLNRGEREMPYPERPERFDVWAQVLCREGLTGRCYWEAEWSGRGIEMGVAYAEIGRKGTSKECALGRNASSWSLNCLGGYFSVFHDKLEVELAPPLTRSRRVGVYLDWPAGVLSYYSLPPLSPNGATTNMGLTHLHTFHTAFIYPLFPGFWLVSDSSVRLCQHALPLEVH
ncbi:hypothetical protein JZ751_008738 [Albula glossodonta]|uniref:NACHT, LRR and PYD domains-containing protein 12-like n=1 Tax=Albula glossodonta TaxID=121402 RepID=A0A8T2NZJ4_9TELE|nr:hypothetical protein JZ751_008738 [Albula glossodonta]